jgi:hypothetical protein
MQAITSLCDRVIVMEKGKKLFDGDTLDGISLYIRLVHNELFDRESSTNSLDSDIPVKIQGKIEKQEPDFRKWIKVPEDCRGGAGAVEICRVSVTKDQEFFNTVERGEQIVVRILLSSLRKLDHVIFGYTIKDRVGLAVFGENSVATLEQIPSLSKGYSLVRFSFPWPEVQSQEYTLTLGVGEGDHPFDHTVQCWAHNIFSLTAITPGRHVHGLFNNRIESITLNPL